jgi:hypothetical protein
MSECLFSEDRRYRYLLIHRWGDQAPERPCLWIALNPSLADEVRLDRTLIRIRGFSATAGFNTLYVMNLFAFVASHPQALRQEPNPIGDENDHYLLEFLDKISSIFVAWGTEGRFRDRDVEVMKFLQGRSPRCLGLTKNGQPRHPLYITKSVKPQLCTF